MRDSKQTLVFLLMTAIVWASFFVLVAALKDPVNGLRLTLASLGFIGLGSLYAALVVSMLKRAKS